MSIPIYGLTIYFTSIIARPHALGKCYFNSAMSRKSITVYVYG